MNKISLISIGTLIGAQGGLGWYMVKSGLDQIEVDSRDGIPKELKEKSSGGVSSVIESVRMLEAKVPTRARKLVTGLTGLLFLTAVSDVHWFSLRGQNQVSLTITKAEQLA
ncbi:hypothetical protein CROQUDRAFT_100627 [Cronartium quercuum f. sp. fusiforme G11]|uniref:Uncharacterized protein n=1 Tax=Cronartium quercuum f. sp. fusiforme G11 TaxID=708437 RepID=A0A9P6T747_9BASI|nr:hypothetical protein CROQUDRAFT_100627 [Cronartium quercuum f. sp. fusiforme G11]